MIYSYFQLVHQFLRSPLSPPSTSISMADKYFLRVTAGPNYDTSTHTPVSVNTASPTKVKSALGSALITVRIQKYKGREKTLNHSDLGLAFLMHLLQAPHNLRPRHHHTSPIRHIRTISIPYPFSSALASRSQARALYSGMISRIRFAIGFRLGSIRHCTLSNGRSIRDWMGMFIAIRRICMGML